MLAAISRALEERDQTQGHGARVAALAEAVVHQLGWGAERIAALQFGALHHDIGKVAVRRDLLRKSGPLSLDELAEIRTHPTKGAELVSPLRAARHALPYVLFHHERWDGKGYPARIRDKAIPIEARLLAVADAFDAMTSPRPYRQALTHERALLELCACAGTQFDPAIVELFLEVWSDRADTWPAEAVAS
jgi:HD-GYP domain-containing protein (c-di-GMP phosphodiesterase class II)